MFITHHQCLALNALILYSVTAFSENTTHRDATKSLTEKSNTWVKKQNKTKTEQDNPYPLPPRFDYFVSHMCEIVDLPWSDSNKGNAIIGKRRKLPKCQGPTNLHG